MLCLDDAFALSLGSEQQADLFLLGQHIISTNLQSKTKQREICVKLHQTVTIKCFSLQKQIVNSCSWFQFHNPVVKLISSGAFKCTEGLNATPYNTENKGKAVNQCKAVKQQVCQSMHSVINRLIPDIISVVSQQLNQQNHRDRQASSQICLIFFGLLQQKEIWYSTPDSSCWPVYKQ